MKTFFKKLKNSNRVLLILYILSIIGYLVSYIFFTKSLISLNGIETGLRIFLIVVFGIYFVVWLLVGILSLFTKKYKPYTIMLVFALLFIALFSYGSYYINTVYNEISDFSKDKVTYTSDLINLKDSNFDASSKIGMISDPNDTEGYILAKKIISANNLDNEIVTYDDYYTMLNDLYNKKIDACFVSNNYEVLFSNEEQYQNIGSDVKVVYTYSEEMANKDNVQLTNKKLTEPFTLLVMGVDSEDDGLNANQAFNGDTLMMITFNPKTLTASMFSVPRDTYVPIGCRNGAYAKINSSAASGTSCVISTLKNLTGVDIDYYIKVNFKGVVDLVNALGGVTVNVEEPYFSYNDGVDYHGQVCEQNSNREFGAQMVCMDPGEQVLNGEQALAYSRDRHQYIGSDLDRIKHQQDVVESIIDKTKTISSFDQFKDILNTIQKNIDTNLTTDQILSLYSVIKSVILDSLNGNTTGLSVYRSYLETYSLPVWTGASTTSALGYYKASLDDITKMMRINLELESAIPNTSYEIDYKEDYTTKAYGEGIRSNPQEAIMANLIGSSSAYATSWAKANGLTASIVTAEVGSEHYNSSYGTGVVGDQSIRIGTLLNNYSSVTFYVNGANTVVNNNNSNNSESTSPN
jgi:polyisoprenyl-teichoic acid--peptidoglycan teichoic acid transferase